MTPKALTEMRCRKCGENAEGLLLLALMIQCGARTRDPAVCPIDDGEHDFGMEATK